jgi:hypothetical protein
MSTQHQSGLELLSRPDGPCAVMSRRKGVEEGPRRRREKVAGKEDPFL